MLKVLLFVVLMTTGHEPKPMHKEMDNIPDCLAEMRSILEDLTAAKLPEGGSLQAGCILIAKPTL